MIGVRFLFFLMANAKTQAPQLSSRLLRLSLLWVAILIASVVYTLFVTWQMENATGIVRSANVIRNDLYQVGYTFSTQARDVDRVGLDVQGAVWRIDHTLTQVMVGDDSTYSVMAKDDRVDKLLGTIDQRWRQQVKPTLLRWNEGHEFTVPEREELLMDLYQLNQQIEHWTALIDAQANRNIVVLRYTQVALGGVSILSVIVVMWFLVVSVLRPLNQLGEGIERLRASDWKTQVHAEATQEFSQISAGFNDLASHLDDVYSNLEKKVAEKTSSLAEKNAYLTTLYGLTAYLGEQHSMNELYESFLVRTMTLTGAQAGDIRLIDEASGRCQTVWGKGFKHIDGKQNALLEILPLPATVDSPYPQRLMEAEMPEDGFCRHSGYKLVTVYHIRHKQKNIGLFSLYFNEVRPVDPGMDTLLENLGRHLGAAIENMRLAALDQQLAVGQERNLLAQNLHDSIAQTLSFLNLQVQMLDDALKHQNQEQINDGIKQIKAGVQECYDDVRELLLNFRTRVSNEAFDDIVRSVLDRFERQTHVKAHLTMTGNGVALNSAQKLQAIFILQEALSNVRKHAKASTVFISVKNGEDFEMKIMDDGIGIDPQLLESRKQRHVGLSIMKERAQRISANIEIESEPNQGTTVRFFLPRTKRAAISGD